MNKRISDASIPNDFHVLTSECADKLFTIHQNYLDGHGAPLPDVGAVIHAISAISESFHAIAEGEKAATSRPSRQNDVVSIALGHTNRVQVVIKPILRAVSDAIIVSVRQSFQTAFNDLSVRVERENGRPLVDTLRCIADFLESIESVIKGARMYVMRAPQEDFEALMITQQEWVRIHGPPKPRPIIHYPRVSPGPAPPTDTYQYVAAGDTRPQAHRHDSYNMVDMNVHNVVYSRPPRRSQSPYPPRRPSTPYQNEHVVYATNVPLQRPLSPFPPRRPTTPIDQPHWATLIAPNWPVSPYRLDAKVDVPTLCFDTPIPDPRPSFHDEGFSRVFEMLFDANSVRVKFYWNAITRHSRIVISTRSHNGGPRIFWSHSPRALKISRNFSCLQLSQCVASPHLPRADFIPWLRLNFDNHEDMVVFYSVFVAMKYQDVRNVPHPHLDDARELQHEIWGEHEEFTAELFLHSNSPRQRFRLWRDRGSGVMRIEVCWFEGPFVDVPIWTAFVSSFADKGDEHWAAIDGRIGPNVVSLVTLKPGPYQFMRVGFTPDLDGGYALYFRTIQDARNMISNWTRLCRSASRSQRG